MRTTRRSFVKLLSGSALASGLAQFAKSGLAESSMFEIDADWQVRVNRGVAQVGRQHIRIRDQVTLPVSEPTLMRVHGERVDAMPMYNPNGAPWARGYRPLKLVTFETTATDMLDPATVALRLDPNDADSLAPLQDYRFDPQWGTIGLTPGSRGAGRTVYIDYDCGWSRVDSIVIDAKGMLTVRDGKPHIATPHPPELQSGETAIANIWVPGRLVKLTPDSIYPILEPAYPERRHATPEAVRLLPKTMEKLRAGLPLKLLAWGDSVTAGGQASDPAHQYQSLFAQDIGAKFPSCRIQLVTAAWGGRNSDDFLKQNRGAEHSFEDEVLGVKPDLVVMEFVNDAFMKPDEVEKEYGYLLSRFHEIGAEWIILTPHFVRPDWMGEKTVRVEADPRPYVAGVRQFCASHNVAIADASLRWGHLVKEGIPYVTLLCNSINHPDDRGHRMFADALMELFT